MPETTLKGIQTVIIQFVFTGAYLQQTLKVFRKQKSNVGDICQQ